MSKLLQEELEIAQDDMLESIRLLHIYSKALEDCKVASQYNSYITAYQQYERAFSIARIKISRIKRELLKCQNV